MVKHKTWLWVIALVTAWSVDFLFWGKPVGVSYAILVIIAISGVLILAIKEKKLPAKKSYWLAVLSLLFAFFSFIRQEPFTRGLNYLMSLFALGAFLVTFRGGRWGAYNLSNWIVSGFRFMLNTITLPIRLLYPGLDKQKTEEKHEENSEGEDDTKRSFWKKIAPYIRGALMATPILAILTSLLAAADPIFADWVKGLLKIFSVEYFFRAIYILILTFPVAGTFLYALTKSQDEKLLGVDKPWPPRFLGFIESIIILGSVNLLFFAFIIIQFQYFFGGEKNISQQGYTYAEYARRGFGELLAVAFFTLLIFIILSAITKREKKGQQRIFSVFTVGLTLFIGIILISSLQRLRLYEDVYGFTRLRTYSHICILWIGILFLGILILELWGKWRSFTLATLIAVMGFTLTLSIINVDGFITNQNLERAFQGKKLDINYLKNLSNDAIPTLVKLGNDKRLSPETQIHIGHILACRHTQDKKTSHWLSFHWSNYQAQKMIRNHQALWDEFPLYQDEYNQWYIIYNDEERYCSQYNWD